MTHGIGEAYPEIEELRRSARSGGAWYEGSRTDDGVALTVMVGTDQLTAFDCSFAIDDNGTWATFVLDISGREATSPMSSAPSCGWIGWLNGDIAFASQTPEVETQTAAEWPSRSPFSEPLEELEDAEVLEGFARITAAIVLHDFGDDEGALRILPERDTSDMDDELA